jgi:hypothetical protein
MQINMKIPHFTKKTLLKNLRVVCLVCKNVLIIIHNTHPNYIIVEFENIETLTVRSPTTSRRKEILKDGAIKGVCYTK